MPGFLLKAKGVITRGLAAAKSAQTVKNQLNESNENGNQGSGVVLKLIIIIPSAFFLLFLFLIISIVAYPQLVWLRGESGNTANASAMSSSDADEFYFNQGDGPWANVSYDAGGGTIASSGCGLVSITHCIDILTGSDFTPDEINDQLREYYNNNIAEYAPGGSVVAKLVEFAVGKYGLTSAHYNNVDDAIKDMASGNKVIICSDNGDGAHFIDPAGGKYSANHVIMAYKTDGENVWVKDSGRANGNSVKYTKEEFSKIDFVGWYVLGN